MKERVMDCIARYCKIEKSKMNEDSHVVFDLGLASFDVIELCAAIEQEFGITITDSELFELERIKDIVRCVDEKTAAFGQSECEEGQNEK